MPAAPAPSGRCQLAWHLTERCNLHCPHCLRRAPYQATEEEELDEAQCRRVLDSFLAFARLGGGRAGIEFSGGDPLLHAAFPEMLRRAHAARSEGTVGSIRILGNPETLDEDIVALLRQCAVDAFWISLDGLEAANDRMRGKGSFQAARRGIVRLHAAGIATPIKFTLVRENAADVIPVLRLALEHGIGQVGLGPLILAGGGFHRRDHALTPGEFRALLLAILAFLDGLPPGQLAFRRRFLQGQRLFALLFHELGRGEEYAELVRGEGDGEAVERGGPLFVVWSDGEVVLRREMQRQGWVPWDSFQRIYEHSYLMRMLADRAAMRRAAQEAQAELVHCHACPVARLCPPALVGTFGARPLFQPHDLCWRRRPPAV